jgi:hypothetical protein
MCKTIWHPTGGWAVPIRIQETKTQATINGGIAVRQNAFIDMKTATVLYGDADGR